MADFIKSLANAQKKDDDLKLLETDSGEMYVETNQSLYGTTQMSPCSTPSSFGLMKSASDFVTDDSMMDNVVGDPLPDIRVQSITFMFLSNFAVLMSWIIVSALFYSLMNSIPVVIPIVLVSIFSVLFSVWYIVMLVTRKEYPVAARVALGMFVFSGAVMFWSITALAHNFAAILFLILPAFQSMSVVAYAKISPRFISTVKAMAIMLLTSILTWLVFIFTFVTQQDWIGGSVVGILSLFIILYHGYQIRIIEGRYNVSWNDIQLSVIQFYGDPCLLVWSLF